MFSLRYIVINIIGTLLRGFPLPTRVGLIKIGNPDRSSPVFLTCNYSVTVERVKKALRGLDCYLLVSNTHGINVWCASTGGHLSNHSVISSIKASGVENLVDHREIILPQLAASGVEALEVKRETGWSVKWGPVYAKDIIRFVAGGYKKDRSMRIVGFPVLQRFEMAVMWAFPFSIILAVLTTLIWRSMFVFTVVASWVVPLITFLSFPLYSRFLGRGTKKPNLSKYTVIFNIGWISVALWVIFMVVVYLYAVLSGIFTIGDFVKWGIISFAMMLLVNIDLMGSTPVYKSGLHEERLLRVRLDEKKCTGCGVCVLVCPRDCFGIGENRVVLLRGKERCVQCGGCIVQCPADALCFSSETGKIIPPYVIRRYKLNMMGTRLGS